MPAAPCPDAAAAGGQAGVPSPPWLLTFVDTVSLLLTFLVVLVAQGTLAAPAWQATAAGVRAAFDGPPPAGRRGLLEAPPPPALAPGYLAVVFGERLAALPLLAAASEAPAAAGEPGGLRLTLPRAAVFRPGEAAPTAEAVADLAALGRSLATVGNALIVRVAPEPGGGASGWSDADWQQALGRALSLGAVLGEAGVAPDRLSLAVATGIATDGIELLIEPEAGWQ